jgi:UPF0755 protein
MPMKRSRLSCLFLSAVTAATLVCLLGLAAVAAWYLPLEAERVFGPPAPGLPFTQRLLLSARLLQAQNQLLLPANPYGEERVFAVEFNETTGSIISRLESEGLINDAASFRNYLIYSGMDRSLQARQYRLSPRMSPLEIAQTLQDGSPTETTFNVLAGWRMEEIAAALPTSGFEIPVEAFLAAARTPTEAQVTALGLPPNASLEGFLYPGSYNLPRATTADELVAVLVNAFQVHVTPDLGQAYQAQGLTLHQAVIVASIVQREAVVEAEMPLISSVFLNRLAIGMKLDSDPTAQYALGYDPATGGWWKSPLTLNDLAVASPYNTYLRAGLPPGPIANPGLPALQAVAAPAQTNFYYFRADCDGSGRHRFAVTFEEHLNNACP